MNPEIKKSWIKALRSGKYEQVIGRLTDGPKSYCVLGVLGKEMGFNPVQLKNGNWSLVNCAGRRGSTYLPKCALNAAGLYHAQATKLASLNDNGRNFEALADFIEKHL